MFWTDAVTGKSEWFLIGGDEMPDDGRCIVFYPNGKTYEKYKVRNGETVDTVYIFDMNENIISLDIIKPDTTVNYYLKDGTYTAYHQNGTLAEKGIVENHQRGSSWVRYDKEGRIMWTENKKNNEGWKVWFYPNGRVWDSTYYIHGKKNGRTKHWYENGSITAICNWKMDLKEGMYEFYNEKGQLQSKTNWLKGERHGEWIKFYENGQINFQEIYKSGKRDGSCFEYYENGKLRCKGEFKDDEKTGEWEWYAETGNLESKNFYKDGELIESKKY
jgi:antitoxin component YwqK of YwqJK toxin-antitoxin module